MKKKWKIVSSALAVIFLLGLLVVPASAQTATATATRAIADATLAPGETTEITVTFTSQLTETKSFALDEDIPSGWTFTRGTDDASTFKESTHEWVWFSISAGASKTVTYSLTVPADATAGAYSISGTVTASGVANTVLGDTNITVSVGATATATRAIADASLAPGETTEITVTFTSLLTETKSFALDEDIPSGWTFTRGTDDASTFKESTHEWVWFSISAGASKTVTYSLTVPADATAGAYSISGTVTASGVANTVGGDTDITVGAVPTATATRTIADATLAAGGTTEITVTFTSLLTETKSFALDEDIPSGWTFTRGTDDASTFKESTHEWVWFSISAGASKTVTYSLTAPADAAAGAYSVSGTVTASGVANTVLGDTGITVSVAPTATATRSIATKAIEPGETTAITVTFTSLLTETKSFALDEDIPSGWTFTRGTETPAASTFKAATNEWVWFSISAGASVTVTYSLTAPADAATGAYSVSGTVTASGVANTVGGDTDITVGVGVLLVSIAASPTSVSLGIGGTQQLTITATYSDETTAIVTTTSTYTSSDTTVATVSSGGLITAIGAGSATITVTYTEGAITKTTTVPVTVAAVYLVSIAASPTSVPDLAVGGTQQLTITATYSDDSTADVTATSTYASSDTAVATVSTGGLITGVAAGSATITVTYDTKTTTVSVTVIAEIIQTFSGSLVKGERVTLLTPDIPAGATDLDIELTATADIDLELYYGDTLVIGWGGVIDSAPGGTYQDDTFAYSGYDGGEEYITAAGPLSRAYTLKVYGYKAGDYEVTVSYIAGVPPDVTPPEITITAPDATVGVSATITVSATDPSGVSDIWFGVWTVGASVDWNQALIMGMGPGDQVSVTFTPISGWAGTYTIMAWAMDMENNTTPDAAPKTATWVVTE